MTEWQFILYFMGAVLSGGFFVMFIMPRIEKWLMTIKFNKDLREFTKMNKKMKEFDFEKARKRANKAIKNVTKYGLTMQEAAKAMIKFNKACAEPKIHKYK